jgi:hypothetical protein
LRPFPVGPKVIKNDEDERGGERIRRAVRHGEPYPHWLAVKSLGQSVAFYAALFGQGPTKALAPGSLRFRVSGGVNDDVGSKV